MPKSKPKKPPVDLVPLAVFVADDLRHAARFAVRSHLTAPGVAPMAHPVVVASPDEAMSRRLPAFPRLVWYELGLLVQPVGEVFPLGRSFGGLREKTPDGGWQEVDFGPAGDRISRVALPKRLAEAGTIVVANDISEETGPRPVLTLGLAAHFARAWERFSARYLGDRDGLTAEIAQALKPRLSIILDRWQDHWVVVASPDRIAAELGGLALRPPRDPRSGEPIGPWEDPLVQRATELQLGITHPSQIGLRGILLVEDPDAIQAEFRAYMETIGHALNAEEFGIVALPAPPTEGGGNPFRGRE